MSDYLTVIACTNRKRQTPLRNLCVSQLQPASQASVTAAWRREVSRALERSKNTPAKEVYCGRGFQEGANASQSPKSLWIISAGLGLVAANQAIPPYSITVTPKGEDSIHRLIDRFDIAAWWSSVSSLPSSAGSLAQLIRKHRRQRVLLAISSSYYELIEADLLELPKRTLERIRLVGLSADRVDSVLGHCVMPYDDRFDGPDSPSRGTRSDFPQRAAAHFAQILRNDLGASAEKHANRVSRALKGFRPPKKHARRRMSDAEIRSTIESHWASAQGQSAKMLRVLRDDLGVACEQGRFAQLFREVKNDREGRAA